jgi:hypothetical protein
MQACPVFCVFLTIQHFFISYRTSPLAHFKISFVSFKNLTKEFFRFYAFLNLFRIKFCSQIGRFCLFPETTLFPGLKNLLWCVFAGCERGDARDPPLGVPGDDLLGHRGAHLLVRHGPRGFLRAGVLVRARLPQGDFLQGEHRARQGEVPPRQRVHHPQPAPLDDCARVVLAAGPGAAAASAAQRRPGRRAVSLLAAITFYLFEDEIFIRKHTCQMRERDAKSSRLCSHFELVSHIPVGFESSRRYEMGLFRREATNCAVC